jgi:outer membrane lipoprotein-sorting protein
MIRFLYIYALALVLGLFGGGVPLFSQEILTASRFFDQVSERYEFIQDYEADISITQPDSVLTGVIYYKNPNRIRINFTEPEDQVIVSDGRLLTVYLPEQSVTLTQKLSRSDSDAQGLRLFRQGYSIAYKESPGYVPLEENSREQVIKLNLVWRNTDEGFRQIEMSVGENGFIRRLKGITKDYDEIQIDLENLKTNQNIPEARFNYESPSSSYVIDNFIFPDE